MIGKLDVEEDVMDDDIVAYRKASAVMKTVSGKLHDVIAALGWDCYDNVVVEIGGTQVSGIHQGEDYNKDAFIVIKNLDKNPTISSQPFPEGEFKPRHPYEPKSET